MALPNLTRDQAAERAALVTVDNYRIDLDLTSGGQERSDPGSNGSEKTFHSVTTVTFDALPGAETSIDIAAAAVRSATLNGASLDVSGYDESTGIALTGLQAHNVLVVDADCRYSNTGGRDCTASSTRSTTRCTCTRSSKPPMPSACSPASTSPISRPPSTSPSRRRRTGR